MKEIIKKKLPFLVPAYRNLRKLQIWALWQRRSNWSLQEVFQNAYEGMSKLESASGGGSTLTATERIRKEFPVILKDFGVQSLLDAPCGDFNWMSQIALKLDMYYGCDIVSELIDKNREKYEDSQRKFLTLDITKDQLPKVDLILCRDCLVHLSYENIFAAINNFKRSGSKYLLTTTFSQKRGNKDIVSGNWRPINLCTSPFCFPTPIRLINEGFMGDNEQYTDKSLGLWSLTELTD